MNNRDSLANPTTLPVPQRSLVAVKAADPASLLNRLAKKLVLARLSRLQCGHLCMVDGDMKTDFGDDGDELRATVQVHDPRFYAEMAFGGSLGAGEAYILGYWSADDLTQLIRLMVRNRALLEQLETGLARLFMPLVKVFHWMNRNTRSGSQRNISAHYDLGNDLFELMLDPTMMYSSAFFERKDMSLEQASLAKLERICQKLQPTASDHVLEIGTGWGGFAIYAAGRYGCRVTTTTISREQYNLACQRIAAAGLSDRIEVLLTDYRDLRGQYDKLVSIEMIEAVGYQFYDTYFRQCAALLKPDGMFLLQGITIADQNYESARRSVDFIQRYIFPGSCIPSVTALLDSATRASDFRLFDLEDIGPHYATTLACWRSNFFTHIEKIRQLG